MIVTKYIIHKKLTGENIPASQHIRIALVADLHDGEYTQFLSEICAASPDMIAIAGDLMNDNGDGVTIPEEQKHALGFLNEAVKIAPTFYSLGNNERMVDMDGNPVAWESVEETGAVLLDNSYVNWNGIWVGGLSSVYSHFRHDRNAPVRHRMPETNWLREFDALPGFKILLCHHPEYYPLCLADTDIDLILSGHSHGGQWRIFGHGIYSPGQGFFPKLTSGVHDARLVISRGLANTIRAPRINNPPELVILDIFLET